MPDRRIAVGVVALLLAAGLAAALSTRGSGSANGSVPVRRLDDLAKTYRSTNLYRLPAPLVPGSAITLTVSDGNVSARAGCNSMSGRARVERSRLVMDGIAMTEIGCPPGYAAQDAWVAAMLQAKPLLERSGPYLVLTWDGGQVGFTDAAFTEPRTT